MKAIIIGAGLGGLSAAAYLAKNGVDVTIVEKNSWVGGRVHQWTKQGVRFDLGPSWYLMPDEIDDWFAGLGYDRKQFYDIQRLDPAYKVIYDGESIEVPGSVNAVIELFEKIEHGAGTRLKFFLSEVSREYRYLMQNIIYKNFRKRRDIFSIAWQVLRFYSLGTLLKNYHSRIRKVAYDARLQKILSYPTTFLGGSPYNIPAAYTILNHVDFNLGTWYPRGGFSMLPTAMAKVCRELGVTIRCSEEVQSFETKSREIRYVHSAVRSYQADVVVANADRHFVDQFLLEPSLREMSVKKWNALPLSPAVLNVFLGVKDTMEGFAHHTFFFDSDWDAHIDAVYKTKEWPKNPLFYVHCPAKTDESAMSKGVQSVFALVPLAPGLIDTPVERNKIIENVTQRMQGQCLGSLQESTVFSKIEGQSEYKAIFNAFKGNAFGLAMTLSQTALFRLANRSKKVKNLYFSGQYTVPGTGTTMATISGQLSAHRILQDMSLN